MEGTVWVEATGDMWKVFWINNLFFKQPNQKLGLNGQPTYLSQVKGIVPQG